MEPQSLKTILKWTKGRLLQGDPGLQVKGISIDSRSVLPGEMFLALPGKNYDGHDFALRALDRGASGVILERARPGRAPARPGAAFVKVKNSQLALTDLARGYRNTLKLTVIAVTGSNGKTTTKNLLGQLLGGEIRTLIAPASYNNRVGVALTVFRADKTHRAAVFELGMNQTGEILELGKTCRPQIGVILNVGPAHIGFLGSLDRIARAKGELLDALEGERTAFLNFDDKRVKALAEDFSGRVVSFGIESSVQVRAKNIVLGRRGAKFDLSLSGRNVQLKSPLPGKHNVYNLLAALAVAHHLGIGVSQIQQALLKTRLPRMRMEVSRIRGVTVINDAYNANPASMRAALQAWKTVPVKGKRIVVSGDMNELGKYAVEEHRSWGEKAAAAGLDYLIFIGPLSRHAARAAAEKNFPEERIFSGTDQQLSVQFLKKLMAPGDSILVKASRIMELERIVEAIREHQAVNDRQEESGTNNH